MKLDVASVLAIGFLMGIRHALEPDHVIAVSTIASTSKSLWRSSLAGVFWGIGHTATLFAVGLLLIVFQAEVPVRLSMSLEFLVGVMLVVLGANSLRVYKAQYEDEKQVAIHPAASYRRSTLVGLVHGLAGSAAMAVLTMTTVQSVWGAMAYILVFGAGTVLGMLLFTTALGVPFAWSRRVPRLQARLGVCTGVVSAVFGVYYMYNLGVEEGLFRMWM
jgi:sulfite exporter TauE/SafE